MLAGGIFVAALWSMLRLRSWLSFLPFPFSWSLGLSSNLVVTTLLYIVLTIALLSTHNPANDNGSAIATIKGLSHHFYNALTSAASHFTNKTYPRWLLTHVIPIIILFPLFRAITLLFVLAIYGILQSYRAGVSGITRDVNAALKRIDAITDNVREHCQTARGLEMQALQLVVGMDHTDADDCEKMIAAGKTEGEVESVVREAQCLLGGKVEKARRLAERVFEVMREEGDLEFARDMVGNLDRIVERVVQAETELAARVEGVRKKLWKACLRDDLA
jgi:hypothetical protein